MYLSVKQVKPLKDIVMFNSVKVSFDSIEWQNEADMDPEVIYEDSIPYYKDNN